ncbi:hypothetical protein F7R14_21670 [Pseudomonas lini]|uniref:Uncharacterized protein n=1 Tax=Pseudomonas lini TaxID=163011 RepID=A0A7V7P133_9PSED|nr:hypothetical protein F7R14_21670 [Pseudomonas lini]
MLISRGVCGEYSDPVGAGLLAKAVCQAISALTDTPSSRASPLPQGRVQFERLLSRAGVFGAAV